MATKHAYIRTRVDPEVKEASERILLQLGLTPSEAIRLFLVQVMLRQGLPFEVTLPNEADDEDLLLPAHKRQAAIDACYDKTVVEKQ